MYTDILEERLTLETNNSSNLINPSFILNESNHLNLNGHLIQNGKNNYYENKNHLNMNNINDGILSKSIPPTSNTLGNMKTNSSQLSINYNKSPTKSDLIAPAISSNINSNNNSKKFNNYLD